MLLIFWPRSPLEAPKKVKDPRKKTQINWGNHLGSISGVLGPFRGLYRAPKPTVLHWVYSASRILGYILTFLDPPSQPGQIILVQNDLIRCPTYESFATVGEIRVWWRADFQSGSRVLKKVF